LTIRVLDAAKPGTVLSERQIRVEIALPREYVQVSTVEFSPPSPALAGLNQLLVRLRARAPLPLPLSTAELLLPLQRIPGLLGTTAGTFRGTIPADAKELSLTATGLQFAEGARGEGYVYVNVDDYARAFIFRTTFVSQRGPSTPQEDYQPALRLQVAPVVPSAPQFEVGLEVDNAPQGATLELSLGRLQGGAFQADLVRQLPEARRRRIGFSPAGPGGALLFDASYRDWTVALDTSLIVGPRLLRARLLNAEGQELLEVIQPVRLVNRAPSDVQFLHPPRQAQRGATLNLQVLGYDQSGPVRQVLFFLGQPSNGKLPPNTPTTPGTPVDAGKTTWTVQLPLPPERLGPTDISVQFINAAGLSAFATTTVNILDKLPPTLGTIRGTVFEGPLPQPNLEIALRDGKGGAIKDDKGQERKTTTGPDGTFVFEDVPPGTYKVYASKPASRRQAEQSVTVEAGKTANVKLLLYL
jgi:hypothetical protein